MTSRPDVTLVAPYPPLGRRHAGFSGVASYTANLAQALSAAGAAVDVVAERDGGTSPIERDGAVRVHRSYDRGPRALVDAARAAVTTGAPVVHLQFELFLYGGPTSLPALLPALAYLRRRKQGPVVTLHQVLDPASIDRDTVALHRVAVPPAVARAGIGTVQFATSRLAAQAIVHEPSFATTVGHAAVVPHGIELADHVPKDEARAALDLDDRLVVLCFGFVAPYKGLETVLAAAAGCSGAVQVVVAGGEHPRLAGRDSFAADLEAEHGDHARFTGWVDEADVAQWFAAADVAAFPYPQPFASSGALALALTHRTPVLLSPALARCIGAPSALAVPCEPSAMRDALVGLAREPDRLKELTAWTDALSAGRSWPEVAREHLTIYEEVTDARRAPRRRLRARQPR